MSEKRFVKINHFEIDDTSNSFRPMECASSLDADVICDLLNQLSEENEELKVQNELLIEENKECKALIEKRYGKYLKEKFARKEE